MINMFIKISKPPKYKINLTIRSFLSNSIFHCSKIWAISFEVTIIFSFIFRKVVSPSFHQDNKKVYLLKMMVIKFCKHTHNSTLKYILQHFSFQIYHFPCLNWQRFWKNCFQFPECDAKRCADESPRIDAKKSRSDFVCIRHFSNPARLAQVAKIRSPIFSFQFFNAMNYSPRSCSSKTKTNSSISRTVRDSKKQQWLNWRWIVKVKIFKWTFWDKERDQMDMIIIHSKLSFQSLSFQKSLEAEIQFLLCLYTS